MLAGYQLIYWAWELKEMPNQLCPHQPTGWYDVQHVLHKKAYYDLSKVRNGTIGAGTVLGVQIVIPPNTLHITQSPCLAEAIGVFLGKQDLIFLHIIKNLMRMAGKDNLCIVRIAFTIK